MPPGCIYRHQTVPMPLASFLFLSTTLISRQFRRVAECTRQKRLNTAYRGGLSTQHSVLEQLRAGHGTQSGLNN